MEQGHPFMERLRDNKPLIYSLFFSSAAVLVLASGIIPELQQQFELVELPFEVRFRNTVLAVVVGDIFSVFLIDRVVEFLLGAGHLKSVW
ncbi:putative manganese-transporting ATPase catp-8 [Bulinus truncatus]|nr:putative manganese-transporting ATPase catp-8 [Bulinus truncatus]